MEHGMIRWATKGFPTKGNTAFVLQNTQNTGCCSTNTEATSVIKNNSSDKCGGSGDCC